MPTLTIFAGINGVGKSTLYNFQKCKFWSEDLGERVNPDEILQSFHGDWRKHNDVMKSGRIAIEKITHYLNDRISFNWETTILSQYVIKKMREAKDNGFIVNLFFIGTSNVENSLRRIEKRIREGGHGIPEELVRARFAKQFNNIDEAAAIANIVAFHDNDKVMQIVGAYYCNKLIYKDERCEWMKDVYKKLGDEKTK